MATGHRGSPVQQVRTALFVCCTVLSAPLVGFAHAGAHPSEEIWTVWTFDPLVIAALGVSAVFYLTGLTKLWSSSDLGSGVSGWAAAYFAVGWLSLVAALISPVHAWGEVLFSAHMTQHEILMLVSAPLLVLGRPFIASMWAFPRSTRLFIGSAINSDMVQRPWHLISSPLSAWLIHAAALWVWHIPYLFQATLDSDFVHMLQHLSFFGSALLFWWSIISGRRGLASYGAGVLYLFTTSIHSGVLGAFLTFTHRVWYPVYGPSTGEWGLTPLEDQQLGGLIMWVPAGLVYIAAALIMFRMWLRGSGSRIQNYRPLTTTTASET